MIPNTQFQINPAAQQGTGQQVNHWVDHTVQGMPQFQGGPQVMQPLGGPVAQPLAQPGQPAPMPPVPAPVVGAPPVPPQMPAGPVAPVQAVGPTPHEERPSPNGLYANHDAYRDARNAWRMQAPHAPLGSPVDQNAINQWRAIRPFWNTQPGNPT